MDCAFDDQAKLANLYAQYQRRTYLFILRLVKDSGVAEDLTQETFLCAWQRASLFDPARGAAETWLFAIARNRAIDYLRSPQCRRRQRTESLDLTEDPRLLASLERDTWAALHAVSLAEKLQRLSADERAVIDLAYFSDFSQQEIACKLGQPLGTVKTWVRRALRNLRGMSQSEGVIRGGRDRKDALHRLYPPGTESGGRRCRVLTSTAPCGMV